MVVTAADRRRRDLYGTLAGVNAATGGPNDKIGQPSRPLSESFRSGQRVWPAVAWVWVVIATAAVGGCGREPSADPAVSTSATAAPSASPSPTMSPSPSQHPLSEAAACDVLAPLLGRVVGMVKDLDRGVQPDQAALADLKRTLKDNRDIAPETMRPALDAQIAEVERMATGTVDKVAFFKSGTALFERCRPYL